MRAIPAEGCPTGPKPDMIFPRNAFVDASGSTWLPRRHLPVAARIRLKSVIRIFCGEGAGWASRPLSTFQRVSKLAYAVML